MRGDALSTLDPSRIDTLLVPGSLDYHLPHPSELVAWLREHAPKARRVVSICVGAFLLAEAGLLTRPEFAELHGWIREHMHEDLDLPALAERAGLCPRTLERRYVAKLGQTPLKVLETMRLEAARLSLEDPALSLKEIARRTGFGDQQRLRRAFQRRFGVTPSDDRGRFVGPAAA
jgi:transcriptional regulator GlxA family with amidase domain